MESADPRHSLYLNRREVRNTVRREVHLFLLLHLLAVERLLGSDARGVNRIRRADRRDRGGLTLEHLGLLLLLADGAQDVRRGLAVDFRRQQVAATGGKENEREDT